MNRRLAGIAILVGLAACAGVTTPTDLPLPSEAATTSSETSVPSAAPTSEAQLPGFKFWDLPDLMQESVGRYSEFLDVPTMSVGIYSLPSAASDTQSPHGQDEVYYIVEGEAQLVVQDEPIPVSPGSIVYVRAGVEHRFEPITDDLRTVVLFSSTPTDAEAKTTEAFQLSELTTGAPSRNTWNVFLSAPTLRFGLYRLPASVGGDDPLIHTFDEINFVVSGRGTFRVEDFDLEIGPDSVMFVPATLAHSFHSLNDDLDVLIFWEGGG